MTRASRATSTSRGANTTSSARVVAVVTIVLAESDVGFPNGPRVSIVVRTKDRPQLLAEALSSLARGTYRNVELVLVNDGGVSPQVEP